jgi:ABC-type nitrate/sulfonate/bicarbonate transport system substrate-binding protein
MKTKLLLASALAALALGAGVAQADTKADGAITEAKVSFYFGFYGNPYYGGYYYQPYYYGPKCFYNYWGQYVCKYYY